MCQQVTYQPGIVQAECDFIMEEEMTGIIAYCSNQVFGVGLVCFGRLGH